MNGETITFKKTTVIYLIATFFVSLALFDLFGLITGTRSERGFLGFDMGFTVDGQELDIMGWFGVFVQLYIGYQLFRLNSEGRSCAVILLWLWTIGSGIACLIFSFIFISTVVLSNESKLSANTSINIFDFSLRIDDIGINTLIYFLLFVFSGVQLYFLTRKDIETVFYKSDISKETS